MSSATFFDGPTGRFSLGEAISTSRALIKGTKRHVFGLMVLSFVVTYALDWAFGPTVSYVGIRQHATYSSEAHRWFYLALGGALNAVGALVSTNIGLLRAAGEEATLSRAFRRLDRLPWVMVAMVPFSMLMQDLLETSSWLTLTVVMLAASPAVFFGNFVLDRNLNAFQAIARSYTFAFANFGQLFLYFLLALGLCALIPLSLGIGAIWIVPFLLIANAVIYAMGQGLQDDYRP